MNIILIEKFGIDVSNIILEYAYGTNTYKKLEKRTERKIRRYKQKTYIYKKYLELREELLFNLIRHQDMIFVQGFLEYEHIRIMKLQKGNIQAAYNLTKQVNDEIYEILHKYLDE